MSRYMFIARYQKGAVSGVASEGGTAQAVAVEKAAAELGGHMESFDFAFGQDDAYTILELPDHVAAATFSLGLNAAGLSEVRTVVLVSPQDVDAATNGGMAYSAARPYCGAADDPDDQIPDTLGTGEDEP